jgi:hypothetical protein
MFQNIKITVKICLIGSYVIPPLSVFKGMSKIRVLALFFIVNVTLKDYLFSFYALIFINSSTAGSVPVRVSNCCYVGELLTSDSYLR